MKFSALKSKNSTNATTTVKNSKTSSTILTTKESVKTTKSQGTKATSKMSTSTTKSADNKSRKAFESWKKTYNKTYKTKDQENKAEKNFLKNAKEVDAHNKREGETYKQSLNAESDMSYEEKVKKRTGLKVPKSRAKRDVDDYDGEFNYDTLEHFRPIRQTKRNVSNEVDYTSYFPAIKNQGENL